EYCSHRFAAGRIRPVCGPMAGSVVAGIFRAAFAGLINPACPSLYSVVMVQIRFSLRYVFWIMVFVTVLAESLLAQQSQPAPPVTTEQSPAAAAVNQSPQATPGETPSSELGNLEAK